MIHREENHMLTLVRRLLALAAVTLLAVLVIGESLASGRADAQPIPPAIHRARPPVTPATDSTRPSDPSGAKPGGKINLNTASETELLDLPGVGPKKASLIIEWRTKHGPFQRPQDIRRVKGFGRKTFERLAPFLMVSDRPAATHH